MPEATNPKMMHTLLWTELCTLSSCSNSYIEALTSTVSTFGDKFFKELDEANWGHKGEALIL